ncbi:hypothetical protein CEXT_319811, partial [Caerostris extrusa]
GNIIGTGNQTESWDKSPRLETVCSVLPIEPTKIQIVYKRSKNLIKNSLRHHVI